MKPVLLLVISGGTVIHFHLLQGLWLPLLSLLLLSNRQDKLLVVTGPRVDRSRFLKLLLEGIWRVKLRTNSNT